MVVLDVAVTITPGRTAPVGSETLPVKADVLPVCASADGTDMTTNAKTTRANDTIRFDFTLTPKLVRLRFGTV